MKLGIFRLVAVETREKEGEARHALTRRAIGYIANSMSKRKVQ